MRWPRLLTLTAVALAAAVLGSVLVLGALVGVFSGRWDGPEVEVAVSALLGTAVLVTAVVVAHRVPDNWVGPVIALMGLEPFANAAFDTLGHADRLGSGAAHFFATAAEVSWMWIYVPVGLILAIFPDGRPAGRAGRVALIGLPAVAVAFQLLAGPGDAVGAVLARALVPVFFGLLVSSAVSAVRRYRRGDSVIRAQLRWLALAGIGLPLTLLVGSFGYFVLGTAVPVLAGIVLLYLAVPVATANAVLRHRLFDVDDALVASLLYGLMATLVVGVFTAASAGTGLLLGHASTTAAVVVTAVVAFTLGSLRGGAASRLGRSLFPARERALNALALLHDQVRAGSAAPEDVMPVLRRALGDPGLSVSYAEADAGSAGGASGPHLTTPVLLGDTLVGHLRPGPQARHRPSRDVAAAAALLLETARLRADLATALREVAASRERILLAGYDERRRLERDLHDGAQQRLVSLGVRLRVLQRGLGPQTNGMIAELDEAVAQVATTVSELRQLAHGIRPSSLDDGLAAALAHLARTTPMPLTLDLEGGDDLPDAISTTAYFVAAEAVTNAVRHSEAAQIAVRLRREGDELSVQVSDDGRGGAGSRPGSGLSGLDDRVSGAGGRLRLVSPPGGGTIVEARLPCGS
jgi:signal transduction histidine kinase